jgi:endonuclease/exonuclease/phosphatase family metal-dependent hydrolase
MRGLRLVTLNTWKGDGAYSERVAAMTAGLTSLNPDVIALQEVFAAPEAGYDTAAQLARSLGMTASVLPMRRKVRAVEGRSVDSTSGLAVLSRLPVRSSRSVPLMADRRDGERAALLADLEMDGRTLTVACLHLTHLRGADDLRRRQWREVGDALAECRIAVAAGDFNASADVFDLIGGRFADSRRACGEPPRSTLIADASSACIDHVFFSTTGGLKPTHWQTALGDPNPDTGVTPSDHLAVVTDFAMT